MYLDVMINYLWPMLVLWVLVYLADFFLTMKSARLFQGPMKEYFVFEGSLELTPVFQKDVDTLRLGSPNFWLRLVFSLPLLGLVWFLTRFIGLPQLFEFLMGGLLLREAVVILRHLRNLTLAKQAATPGGLRGKIEYSRWLSLMVSASELNIFGIFYFILAILLTNWFFMGGALTCLVTGYQHWRYSRKQKPFPPAIVEG